ncbi:DUF1206 domain-containing protein [Microbacterium thalassium]|uniref:DUF1206 domain-containing protein n=1 Tax=Microbacterium thalassium TaxID=362649 RepID=A0A7X0FQV9_9MICO|nr:DUF1206 domain-containing protein [Microbacterium thalassium]MBB6391462.1 hypothetical protein [Microbacterium thalassium]GLK24145.1 membrane protein [Microbacterium thalassium]
MTSTHKHVARKAESTPAFRALARVGFAANGVVHILIGAIAFAVAFGGGGESDQSGAMKAIADAPLGFVLLWVLVIGLLALTLWYVVEGILARGDGASKWGERLASWGRAVAYLFLGYVALNAALGGNPDSEESTEETTSGILQLPGGPILVGIGGVAVLVIAGYFVFKGATRKFEEQISMPGGTISTGVRTLGIVGYISKGIALGIIGVLLIVAAVQLDPEKAAGFDGALKSLLGLPFGPWLVAIIGAGLIAYGIYQFARARYAKL